MIEHNQIKKDRIKKKNRKVTKRSNVTFQPHRVRSEKLEDYRNDQLPSRILDEQGKDGQSIADRELKRMVQADVFRSNRKTVQEQNSNPSRYRWAGAKEGRKY